MKVFTFFAIGLLTIGLLMGSALAQQAQSQNIQLTVFNDANASSSYDIGESPIAGWTIELYDDSMNYIGSFLSVDVVAGDYAIDVNTSVICQEPVAGWIHTTPATGVDHPADSSWTCVELTTNDGFVNLGAFLIDDDGQEGEVEDGGDIINQFPEKLTPEPNIDDEVGDVLGATDDANVLAETGNPTSLIIAVGTMILIIAGFSAKNTVYYRK